ncbi:MAG: SMP-30/gluconolactonase/LRE family protein [Hyphomonadaceae bacterium]
MREMMAGLGFPEGPVALADGSLLCVELDGGFLTRVRGGKREVVADLGGSPNGAAIGPDGWIYVCNNGGIRFRRREDGLNLPIGGPPGHPDGWIERVHLETGKVERLYTECDGVPLYGPNDIVFDRRGGFWFTDLGGVTREAVTRGAIYYARTDGSFIRRAAFPLLTPNGVGLSPDGATLYVAETLTARLWAYDVVGEGELSKAEFPSPNGGRILYGAGGYARYDSMAVEENGNICVATLESGGVTVISPTGALVEFRPMPDIYCTNICFGGPDMRTAYLTLSSTGRLVAVEWPRPGLRLLHG